jgi:hypothetical protein
MDLSTRLKGLLDPGILGGMFDGSPDETLSRFLPTDQIDRIPADKRAWYAQQAIRSTQADGRAGAQQRLLEFAKLREDQILAAEKARRAAELRGEIDQATNPMYRGMSIAAEQGAPLGPTKIAQSLAQTTAAQLPSMPQAIRIKALGGPDLTEAVIKARTPIAIPTGNAIHPVTGAMISTPKLPDGMVIDASGAVRLANGFLPAQGAVAQQASEIETQAAIARQPLMRVDGPDGATLVGSITGTPPPARPGMPPPAGRPGVAPQPQPGMDYDSQIEEAVMAGNAQRVARLQAEQARAMGRPAPMGISEAYKQAQKVFEGRTAADLKTSSDALVKTVQPSFDGAMAARGSLDKTYELKNLIRSGVYTKQGIIPGDYVEMAARVFGNDPEKLANTRALKVASLQALLDMAAKLKPPSDTDIKLLNSGISNPDSMTEREMMRITDNLIADHKKTIKGHGDTLKRFPADRLSTAFGGMNLSVDEPKDPYERQPSNGQTGLGTPTVSGRVVGTPARPGFTFREIK